MFLWTISFSHTHIIKIETSGTQLDSRNGDVWSFRATVVTALQTRTLLTNQNQYTEKKTMGHLKNHIS